MRRWLVLSLLFVLAPAVALADGTETGVITGVVTDASGSPLPGVQVTLEGDRAAQVAVTGEDGKFVFGLVPPGGYKVTAALEGFGSKEQAANVTAGSRVDFEMKLSLSTAEQITVTSEAPLVDKFNVTAGATMQGETAGEISASVRSFYGALQVLPGVTNDVESSDLSNSRPNVNGALWQESNVYVDGVDATFALQGGGTRVFLPSSALTEVNMEAGGGGAEYGRNVGSHTNLIVKSGTNKFHGDFNGVYSNLAWNSNYDPQPVLAKDQRLINTYLDRGFSRAEAVDLATNFVVYGPGENTGDEINIEASLGGPIKRDKAWFFLSRGEVSTNQRDKTLDGQIFNVSSELFASVVKINFQPGAKPQPGLHLHRRAGRPHLPAAGDGRQVRRDVLPAHRRRQQPVVELVGEQQPVHRGQGREPGLRRGHQPAVQPRAESAGSELSAQPGARESTRRTTTPTPTSRTGTTPGTTAGSSTPASARTSSRATSSTSRSRSSPAPTTSSSTGSTCSRWSGTRTCSDPTSSRAATWQLGTRYGFANDCVGFTNDPVLLVNSNCFLVDYNNHGLPKGSASSQGDNYGAYLRDRITVG